MYLFSVHGLIAGLDRELGYWDLTTDAEIRHFPAVAGGSGKDQNNVKKCIMYSTFTYANIIQL